MQSPNTLARICAVLVIPLAPSYAAGLSPEARALIDSTTGGKGMYLPEEGVYKVLFPRPEAVGGRNGLQLSRNFGYNSWAAFSSAVHHPAMLRGEFLLLQDEVNLVVKSVLDGGLEVTGLAGAGKVGSTYLHSLDVTGFGQVADLAAAFRKGRDAIERVRAHRGVPTATSIFPRIPQFSAIDAGPLDAVLSMRGTVGGGIYRAGIGRRAVLGSEVVGREMGVSTWVAIAGSNEDAVAQGEFVCSADELRKVLQALLTKSMDLISVRNHTIGEHPQFIYVRFTAHGGATDIARRIRYVLDVQVGIDPQRSGAKV